jgi:hypothetical protein
MCEADWSNIDSWRSADSYPATRERIIDGGGWIVARETITKLIDDLDGSDAHATITFGLDSATYEIDLNASHDTALRAVLAPYIDVARRGPSAGSRTRAARAPGATKDRNAAIRQWAASEGAELPARGRIAGAVKDAFDAQDGDALRSVLGIELAPKTRRRRAR